MLFLAEMSHTYISKSQQLLPTSLWITVRVIAVGNIHFGKQCVCITGESWYLLYMNFKLIVRPLVSMIYLTIQRQSGVSRPWSWDALIYKNSHQRILDGSLPPVKRNVGLLVPIHQPSFLQVNHKFLGSKGMSTILQVWKLVSTQKLGWECPYHYSY